MRLFSAPKLPVSAEQRAWIDAALERLIGIFGEDSFAGVAVLPPKDDAFPEWDGTEACVPPLLARVCGYMRADPGGLAVEILPDIHERLRRSDVPIAGGSSGAAGLYRPHRPGESDTADSDEEPLQATISVKESLLGDPIALISTLAHETGHVRLLGEGHVLRDEPDMEPLTDLCSLFWGFGIFSANSAFNFIQRHNGWRVSRKGYLSQEMWGYALAAWANRRGDNDAKWSRHLCTNVRAYFQDSRDYLRREQKTR